MPIFEYACRDCGREFEAFVTRSRTPTCPGCEGGNLSKLLSRPGMVGAGAERSEPAFPASGGCGAGGAGCACRMPDLN
ncbi:MAG TPA: zinc ribbon domain-containing protein [Vicinamibacterales bacterium]|nr:zinc ribbon domain-containing protein [Vicinamibacterales bacterium]